MFRLMLTAIVLLTMLPLCQHAWADADTDDDAAQAGAIMNALLQSRLFPDSQLASVMVGDLNADGQPDALVTYSHGPGNDGGNSYSQRLALFLSSEGRWALRQHVKVGGKGTRLISPVSVSECVAVFLVTFWRAGDNACCPSGETTTRFVVRGESLQEL